MKKLQIPDDPEILDRMLNFFPTDRLRLNVDTGNTFIAGGNPVAFVERFLPKLSYMHGKDVSASLAARLRGEETGIAMSESPIGSGVNADDIQGCIRLLKRAGWSGVLSVECSGTDENLAASIDWLRRQISTA